MVVFRNNKNYITNSRYPDENFTKNEDVYVVPDDSDIANKILDLYPFYDFVVDEKGMLIDVVEVEHPEPEPIPALSIDDIALAVAELAENQAQSMLEVQEAIAELAEIIVGGE